MGVKYACEDYQIQSIPYITSEVPVNMTDCITYCDSLNFIECFITCPIQTCFGNSQSIVKE